ncbi:MAG: hypothetical protein IKX70_06300 [Treponema sp.]|nr:hypothetical protein [Treponema sp.]
MSDDIESFSALMDLTRTSTINLTDNRWPDEQFSKHWNDFIGYLKSFSDEENGLSDITDRKLELLQKLVDLFFKSEEKDINIIRNGNKKNISQILYAINRLEINKKPLSDESNLDNLILLLSKIPQEDYPRIAVPLLRFYLSSVNPEERLSPRIITIFSKLDPSKAIFEKDIQLYVNHQYIVDKLCQSGKGTILEEALRTIGVSERYLTTPYMRALFYIWFFSLKKFTYDLLEKNKTNIHECTSDEKKLLFAKIIVSTFNKDLVQDKDTFIRKVDENYFPTPKIDKTEEEYWSLINSELQSDKNVALLKSAHSLYINIFTRFIITQFFDSLSDIAGDRNGQVRANYWRRYGSSDSFVDIKIVVNSWQKRRVYEGLTPSERSIFAKHIIINQSEGYTEVPVFIMIFKSKTVVVFLQTGHSAQVFNSDNAIIQNILKSPYVYSSKELTIYTTGTVYESREGQGRVIQSGSWQFYFSLFLSRNGIHQGKE